MDKIIRYVFILLALVSTTWITQVKAEDSIPQNNSQNIDKILNPSGFINNLPERAERMGEYLLQNIEKDHQTSLRHRLFEALFFIILYFIILITILPLIIDSYTLLLKKRAKHHEKVFSQYKEQVIKSLINDSIEKRTNKYPKNLLVLSLFYELGSYLKGKDRNKLDDLFIESELEEYARQKLNRPFSHKTLYLRYISIFSLSRQTMEVVEKCAHDSNSTVRLYAMMILIKKNPERIITLFANYSYQLSLLEQIQYYDFFMSNEISLPMFHPLTLSRNDSIALFALRMIRMFHQKRGSIEGYESLLSHPNPYVRAEMFHTLFKLGYPNLKDITKSLFEIAPLSIKLHIITFIANGDNTTISELMDFFNEYQTKEIQQHVLESIFNYVEGGKEFIRTLSESEQVGTAETMSRQLLHKAL